MPPEPSPNLSPALAAALFALGALNGRHRPMLAAQWLAEGADGEALRNLAWLTGDEREVNDLWPEALREMGVELVHDDRRTALSWAAERVVEGEWSVRRLVSVFWPPDEDDTDAELDLLIYTIDDGLDWIDRDLRSGDGRVRARAESARRTIDAAVAAMARGDLPSAMRTLAEWGVDERP